MPPGAIVKGYPGAVEKVVLRAISLKRERRFQSALEMESELIEALPGDLRTIVKDTGAIAAKALTDKIKAEDTASFDRMMKKMTKYSVDAGEFEKTFKEVRKRLAQGTFSAELVKKIEQAGGL